MKIIVIHTGGTIGMTRSPAGFSPAEGVVEEAIETLRQQGSTARDITVLPMRPLIDSANATPADWNRISQAIALRHDDADGFVVTHGTDTMAYCAAALCFALEGLSRPVILTGAMLPLTEDGSDGMRNLGDALRAVTTAPAGVWVQFAGKLLHGARVRKSHSRLFDAFAADISEQAPCRGGDTLHAHQFGDDKVALLPVAPGLPMGMLNFAVNHYDGIILRCYGSGTVPNSDELEKALGMAQSREVPVIAVSQCPEGGIAMGTYAAGDVLCRNRVVDGRDMTAEAAYVKLLHVLGRAKDFSGKREILAEPLCGELTV